MNLGPRKQEPPPQPGGFWIPRRERRRGDNQKPPGEGRAAGPCLGEFHQEKGKKKKRKNGEKKEKMGKKRKKWGKKAAASRAPGSWRRDGAGPARPLEPRQLRERRPPPASPPLDFILLFYFFNFFLTLLSSPFREKPINPRPGPGNRSPPPPPRMAPSQPLGAWSSSPKPFGGGGAF